MITEAGVEDERDTQSLPRPPQRRVGPWVGAIVAIVSVILVIGYVAARPTGPDQPSLDDFLTQADSGIARIEFEGAEGDLRVALDGSVAVADDLRLTANVTPNPPTSLVLELDLYLTDAAGQPIPDAAITGDWDMIVMSHGVVVARFPSRGDGHYVAELRGIMFGLWALETTITVPGESPEALTISIYVWPE